MYDNFFFFWWQKPGQWLSGNRAGFTKGWNDKGAQGNFWGDMFILLNVVMVS